VSVTGMPGLYQLISSKGDGAIVRTLDGKSTKFVAARSHNFTPLESIEVFTNEDNIPLLEVFKAMKENEPETSPAGLSNNEQIHSYFDKVFPSLDKDRVYISDMKKMLKWYPLLKAHDLLTFSEKEVKEEEENEKN